MRATLVGENPPCDIFILHKLLIFSQLPVFTIAGLPTCIQSQGCHGQSLRGTIFTIVGGGLHQS